MIPSLEKAFNAIEAQRTETLKDLARFSEEQLSKKKDAATWSINQVLEHLYLSELATWQYMKKKTSSAEQLVQSGFKHFWRSLLLKYILRSPKKFKLPKNAPIDPSGSITFGELNEKWNVLRKDFRALLEGFDEATADKLIFKHPRAGYFNARQTLLFTYEHFHHHLRQLNELKAEF